MDVSLQIGFALQAGLPMLRENNVQKGFFGHGDFIKVGNGRGFLSRFRKPSELPFGRYMAAHDRIPKMLTTFER